ncbi:putative membrane protein YpjA [Paenibacillus sp. V4I3]|uniref:DUF1405 domain-containing protein n=1 Tax=unclassified Paenibacillus TaxID=185978 RepID=UPI00277E4802|nr:MULTISPECIES: DUF1405 domain-containing protein [unclassified Paenibacillus]MDQ0875153.1 putative membrane protein YpjA [Paenibacillus sp. V4I3]MDQ0889115.1 putative membrane protein YpjA [Paenibacillus sp. V4I9]
MQQGLSVSYFWSKDFLLSKKMLWAFFISNLLGTVYGYEWYWAQMVDTIANYPVWYVYFVPDSPTASLFFTLSIGFLLMDRSLDQQPNKLYRAIRGFVEAFALITSFKYGIWAVAMIWTGAWQGVPVGWDGWMLTGSHLAMAVEALLFVRWYRYRLTAIIIVAMWTFWNDFMDYERGIFPRLPRELDDNLLAIEWFTVALSISGILIAVVCLLIRKKRST